MTPVDSETSRVPAVAESLVHVGFLQLGVLHGRANGVGRSHNPRASGHQPRERLLHPLPPNPQLDVADVLPGTGCAPSTRRLLCEPIGPRAASGLLVAGRP
jgi:hypothetical protein